MSRLRSLRYSQLRPSALQQPSQSAMRLCSNQQRRCSAGVGGCAAGVRGQTCQSYAVESAYLYYCNSFCYAKNHDVTVTVTVTV